MSRNAWSNALACAVGGAVGRWGTLFQCSSEEAEELRIGMAGFTSYAETVSVYGTEKSFTDGDDTPWSKAFLAAAYASRGIKMRCTSGAGSELLMGFHESKSLLYLEARCLCLQRGMGVQGTQNGGIDGAPLTATSPRSGRPPVTRKASRSTGGSWYSQWNGRASAMRAYVRERGPSRRRRSATRMRSSARSMLARARARSAGSA